MIVHIYLHISANNAFLCMFLAYLHIFPECISVHIQYCIFLNIFLHIDICLEFYLIAFICIQILQHIHCYSLSLCHLTSCYFYAHASVSRVGWQGTCTLCSSMLLSPAAAI